MAWLLCALPIAMTWFEPSLFVTPTAIFFVFPLAILGGAVVEIPAKRIGSWLGDVSYPLYAIHQPIVVAGGGIVVPLVIAAAHLLGRYYDRPIRKWLKGISPSASL